MNYSLRSKLLAEFLGTFFLLATVVGSGIMAEMLSGGNVAVALLGNTIPTGAILYVMITMFGSISGAHFNPAVTVAFALRGLLPSAHIASYIVVQIVAAILGVLVANIMFDLEFFQVSEKVRSSNGQWISEIVATFGLIVAIFYSVKFKPDAVAAVVGLYITAAYWFTASTSFANPAVTIARQFSNTFAGIAPSSVFMFLLMQFIGVGLAIFSFKLHDVSNTS